MLAVGATIRASAVVIRRLDDQRVPLPMTVRLAPPLGNRGRHLPSDWDHAHVWRAILIQNHHIAGRLHNLLPIVDPPWRHVAWKHAREAPGPRQILHAAHRSWA